jgi:hypothetical protein
MLFFIAFEALAAGLIFTVVPAPWNTRAVVLCGILAIVLAAIAYADRGVHLALLPAASLLGFA